MRPLAWAMPALVLWVVMAGCAGTPAIQPPQAVRSGSMPTGSPKTPSGFRLPATFVGVLPCADCPGIRYQLNLWPDGLFFLRTTYLERPVAAGETNMFDEIGLWSFSADRRTLTLRGSRAARESFTVVRPDLLRKLDQKGRLIESELNYDLSRQKNVEPLEPRLLLRGLYSYYADAGRLKECFTGRTFPVAREQDNRALEDEYLKLQQEPGEWLLANLEARVVRRPKMEGAGEQPVILVERFIKIRPGETCETSTSTLELEQAY
ncbi:MAG TPA: copper resistance protein NlpE N-terminal domain-containing protein [Nitrospiraceae bacterium]|nr:copper resistance protein NlpE N-terminal domain-containing protein [Nitrospiraceae bacterium]